VQSLIGDTSDNVPGVPGIGVKTAAQLIIEYGDLDAARAPCEIKPAKRRGRCRRRQEGALLSFDS
jgi:DNA polymerase-1